MTDQPGPDALDSLTLDWLRMVRLAQSALSHATATLLDGDPVAGQGPVHRR
jgi:hypothetical protein